jgi:hypothetical protein
LSACMLSNVARARNRPQALGLDQPRPSNRRAELNTRQGRPASHREDITGQVLVVHRAVRFGLEALGIRRVNSPRRQARDGSRRSTVQGAPNPPGGSNARKPENQCSEQNIRHVLEQVERGETVEVTRRRGGGAAAGARRPGGAAAAVPRLPRRGRRRAVRRRELRPAARDAAVAIRVNPRLPRRASTATAATSGVALLQDQGPSV